MSYASAFVRGYNAAAEFYETAGREEIQPVNPYAPEPAYPVEVNESSDFERWAYGWACYKQENEIPKDPA